MAEQRATRPARASAAAQAKNGGKQPLDVDRVFDDLERKARTWLESFSGWVNQGDELLTKGREWIEEHPVALGFAKKYGRNLTFVPTSMDELRESARTARTRLQGSATRGIQQVKANPIDTALIAGALGIAAFVFMRER